MTIMASSMETLLQDARRASYAMAQLTTAQKNEALDVLAEVLLQQQKALLVANQIDLQREEATLSPSLFQRLKLDAAKITQLAQGIRDVARLPDPVGSVLQRTLLDDGLILSKVQVPLGVIAIIFESRPDVIPQIVSLILKSGNAVILKGGKEAQATNAAMMNLLPRVFERCPFLPCHWAQLVEGREAVHALLSYPQYVDLVIPRGSNELVQSIMAATRIPVLGHADGVCHLYVHASANLDDAIPLVIDAKAQYPAACNALETLLVHRTIAAAFLPGFVAAAQAAGITLKACEHTQGVVSGLQAATQADWVTEYGDLTLAVKVVASLEDAILHINTYGSHHTDGILAQDHAAQQQFLSGVGSACVFVNASTRFADGFRFGLGAEIGISTSKTHARGPVGLEGLVTYQYQLMGQGHTVQAYTGQQAKPFQHILLM